jgi:hypothetical protein
LPENPVAIVNFCSERRGDYQPRYTDAEPVLKQSLATREKTLGPDHPDVALPLNNLADFYCTRRSLRRRRAAVQAVVGILLSSIPRVIGELLELGSSTVLSYDKPIGHKLAKGKMSFPDLR